MALATTTLGRTGLVVTRTGFGALPIQRVDMETAGKILRRAYEGGITFFDTARAYSDSEEKIGRALGDVREDIVIATKSLATDRAGVLADLAVSLRKLQTDYVDVMQLHNPAQLPDPTDAESSYAGLVEARNAGMVRHIGMTQHRITRACDAVQSGLYDTMQFPLSAISSEQDLELIDLCAQHDVGLIAMKAFCGGLLTNARMAVAFLRQYENVVPIWGVQRMRELAEILALDAAPPVLDAELLAEIEAERRELAGEFCRACGYCLPCPSEIKIPMAARMALLLRRAPSALFLTPEWQAEMRRINDCTECGQCRSRCPYGLDIPPLLKKMLADYEEFLAAQP
jgi:aryl-alcohol dehydrogenase-like predicted oxidoreductase